MIPRFIHSGMAGAPAVSSALGGALSMLNAALVDGFNVTAPQSVSASGGVVTFTYLAAHGYESKCWVRISGAGAAALNADLQCTVPGPLSFTVAVPGIPDGPVGGSIAVKVAPLGWERVYTDTNVAVYRSPNLASSRMYLQVRDVNPSGNTSAKLRGFESMTSAAVGVDPFPTLTQAAADINTPGIPKTTGGYWAVVGDDKTFYVAHAKDVSTFGDIASLKPGDAYGAFLFGGLDNNGALASCLGSGTSGDVNGFLCRDGTGLQKSLPAGHMGFGPGTSGQNRVYPGPNTGGVTLIGPMLVLDGTSSSLSAVRGVLRGLLYVMEAVPTESYLVLDSVPGINGRVLILRDRGNSSLPASVALPIDQEW